MNSENVLENIVSLSGKIDQKIESLEFQISETLKGRFALLGNADIAEDLLKEVEDKTKFAEDALKAIKEDILVEDAFIKKAFEDARWLEESVAQVELLAQQYGYTPKTRPKVDEAFEQFKKERKQRAERDSSGSSNQDQLRGKETPNLITCGLSKRTLGNLGYKFKEGNEQDIDDVSYDKSGVPYEKESCSATFSNSVSPLPISKRSLKKLHALGEDQFSLVEISPGLVVRRPSSRNTSNQSETPIELCKQKTKASSSDQLGSSSREAQMVGTNDPAKECARNYGRSNIHDNQQDLTNLSGKTLSILSKQVDSSLLNDDFSPQMPALATVNIQKILNQKGNQTSHRPMSVQAADHPPKLDSSVPVASKHSQEEDSPSVPILSTINITNLKSLKNDSTPSYLKDYQSARREQPVTLLNRPTNQPFKEEDSPVLPSLSTVNVHNLLKGYDLTRHSGKEN